MGARINVHLGVVACLNCSVEHMATKPLLTSFGLSKTFLVPSEMSFVTTCA